MEEYPAFSSRDVKFMMLALGGKVGELADIIKKRWRDGVDGIEDVRNELANIRVYLELIAKCYGIEGEKLNNSQSIWETNTIVDEGDMAISLLIKAGKLVENITLFPSSVSSAMVRHSVASFRLELEYAARLFDIGGSRFEERVQAELSKAVAAMNHEKKHALL